MPRKADDKQLNIVVEDELLARIADFQAVEHFPSKSSAVRALIYRALSAWEEHREEPIRQRKTKI